MPDFEFDQHDPRWVECFRHAFAAWSLSEASHRFLDAIDAGGELDARRVNRERMSFVDSAVALYGRPVSYKRNATGDLDRTPPGLDQQELALHQAIRSHRDKVVAHIDPEGAYATLTFDNGSWSSFASFGMRSPKLAYMEMYANTELLERAAHLAKKLSDRYSELVQEDMLELVPDPADGLTLYVGSPEKQYRVTSFMSMGGDQPAVVFGDFG